MPNHSIVTRLFALILSLLIGTAVSANAAPTPDAASLERKIATAIDHGLRKPRPKKQAVLTVSDGNKFVQCRQAAAWPAWRCEAANSLMQPSLQSVLTPDRVANLRMLGFQPDRAFGNFAADQAPSQPSDHLAHVILSAMLEGYATNPANIAVQTTYIPDRPCPPRIDYSQDNAGAVNVWPRLRKVTTTLCVALPHRHVATDVLPSPLPTQNKPAIDVVARYTLAVARELRRLRLSSAEHIWIVLDDDTGYVQCKANHQGHAYYCEAASADSMPKLGAILTPAKVAILHVASFDDPGRRQNYATQFPFKDYGDRRLASMLLIILRDVYGLDGTRPLKAITETGKPRILIGK